jgi:hypothetical protein
MTLAAGTKFGPYEILAPLGAGGMGKLYRSLDTRHPEVMRARVRALTRSELESTPRK